MDLDPITLSGLASLDEDFGAREGDIVIFDAGSTRADGIGRPVAAGRSIEHAMQLAKEAAENSGVPLDDLLGRVYRVVADPPPALHKFEPIGDNAFGRWRVAGGWLYERLLYGDGENGQPAVALCFVPDVGGAA